MKRLLLLLLLLLLPFGGFADEEPGSSARPAGDLIQETLGRDIETASYYELIAWCRELGLDDSGTRQALQQRLYAHFRIEPPLGKAKETKKRILEIKSARETEYFTVQEIDENYVLLQGDVLVELQEEQAVHRIRAQRILLNQSADILTAEGNIEYTLTKGDKAEVFRGERITFNVESWQGAFFKGGMEGDRDVGGKKVHFYFLGDAISKLENNTVVMDNGVITSCEQIEEPHYQIKARKIWVLAPGEWAIFSAILYVGYIPVLYLPAFFHPGDEFFFHPAIGYRDREGNFIQTTTYLIGQKPRTASPLSFLAATEQSDVQYRRQIRGLFLRQIEGEQVLVPENSFLKVLLDFYSRLGGFAGVSGEFPPTASLRTGVGFSRNIYTFGGLYTPWIEDGGVFRSVWNKSWLFGIEVPFRFGLDSKLNLSSGSYRLSGKFEYFADPFFLSDFFNRAEETALTRMMGLEESTPVQTAEVEKRGLTWEIIGQAELSKLTAPPLLKKLSIPYFSGNLYWQSRSNQLIPVAPHPDSSADPSRLFYYPVSFKLPNVAIQLGGDLITLPRTGRQLKPEKASEAVRPPAALKEELRLPSALISREPMVRETDPEERSTSAQAQAGSTLRKPKIKEDLPLAVETAPFSFLLSYQVRPGMVVEQSFNSAEWKDPSEVTYDLNYTSLESSGSTSLDYSLRMYDKLLTLNGNLILSGNYRTRFRQSFAGTINEWNSLVSGDYLYTQANLRSILNLSLVPFAPDPQFGSSNLSYSLNWILRQYALDPDKSNKDAYGYYVQPIYSGIGPEWTPGTVSQHTLQAFLAWQPGSRVNSLTISAQLPPLDTSITSKAEFYVWLLKTTLSTVFRERKPEEDWPLVVQEALQVSENVRLVEELQFDLAQGSLEKSISSLILWGLTASFTTDTFSPTNITAGYRLSQKTLYFWKNRARLEAAVDASWSMNLQEASENSLNFSFNLKFFIYKFLELSFTSISYNTHTYRYFPGLAEQIGEPWVNPLTDLLRSFNFAYLPDRQRSGFKLKSILLEMVHHLHDWDLTLRYEGKPALDTSITGDPQYKWASSFSIILQWIPIPEVRSTLSGDEEGFSIRG